MKIFINPGHCPNADSGAVGNGLRECDVALNIGRRVEEYLRAVGYDVKLFQYDGLAAICYDANSWGADYFISIHCNAGGGQGTETFYYSETGRKLAECIQNQIVSSLPVKNRGVKTAEFYVLNHTDMPAVLVETAFIDNSDDAKLLRDKQDEFARAIARGVTDFFLTEKPLPDTIDKHTAGGRLSEHFQSSEFVCHCCGMGGDKISSRLIELLESLRANIGGLPLHVNSGYRCPKHNKEVGGVKNSQHLRGAAADIATPKGMELEVFKWYAEQLPFDFIGVYPKSNFLHLDVRDGGISLPPYVEYEE